VVVFQVAPGSPAARAGLTGVSRSTGTVSDIIVEADGGRVRRLPDLIEAIEKVGVGQAIEITALHDGRTRKVRIEIVDIGGS
jgi:2-alkenal reductase